GKGTPLISVIVPRSEAAPIPRENPLGGIACVVGAGASPSSCFVETSFALSVRGHNATTSSERAARISAA
ncbi:MAG: hypothetical protein ABI175_01430, partial [Polyangiales bacterium]